jgi:hypothetical protein
MESIAPLADYQKKDDMDILGNMSGDMTNLDATVEGIH